MSIPKSQNEIGVNGELAITVQGVDGGKPLSQKQSPVTNTNLSGTVITGGQAQELSPAQSQNQTYFVENVDTTNEMIWINFLGGEAAPNAAGSVPLRPQSGTNEGGSRCFTTDKSVSIYAATTGHKYTALRLAQ